MSEIFAQWTGLDFAIAGIVFLSLLLGLIRGFIKEVVSLLAWIVAFFAAIHFSSDVSEWLSSAITNPVTRYVVAVILIFLAVIIAGCVVGKIIRALLKVTGFGFFDRLLGLIFGAARGVLFVTILLIGLSLTTHQEAGWVKSSQLAPSFAPLVQHFSAELPKEIKTVKTASEVVQRFVAVAHDFRSRT